MQKASLRPVRGCRMEREGKHFPGQASAGQVPTPAQVTLHPRPVPWTVNVVKLPPNSNLYSDRLTQTCINSIPGNCNGAQTLYRHIKLSERTPASLDHFQTCIWE